MTSFVKYGGKCDNVKVFEESINIGANVEFYLGTLDICGINWFVSLQKKDLELVVSVKCGYDTLSLLWNCSTFMKICIDQHDTKEDKMEVQQSFTFSQVNMEAQVIFVKSANHLSEEQWSSLNRFKLELAVNDFNGHRNFVPFYHNLEDPDICHDRVLIVEGRRIYVQSVVMSMWSSFFDKLFNSSFKEGKMDEIAIEDVSADHFIEMLLVIYPCDKPIEAKTLPFLLNLSDRFEMPFLTARCSRFLCETDVDDYSLFDMAEMVVTYKLIDAQEVCLEHANRGKYGNIAAMIRDKRADFLQLSTETRLFLLDVLVNRQCEIAASNSRLRYYDQ